jgi:hypothetical protein
MILDSEAQRKLLIAAVEGVSWTGNSVRQVAALLDALERAPVAAQRPTGGDTPGLPDTAGG